MSDQDKEEFLVRWSRRKRESADAPMESEKDQTEMTIAAPNANAPVSADASVPPAAPEFDVSSLPPIESIGANSDIAAFLRPGVPSALKHAALRRAWVADPAIRDFKGMAEYDWDFTAAGSMEGFGEIGPDIDVRKMVAEIFRGATPATDQPAESTASDPDSEQPTRLTDKSVTGSPQGADEPMPSEKPTAVAQPVTAQGEENAAEQQENREADENSARPKRHGSALPQS